MNYKDKYNKQHKYEQLKANIKAESPNDYEARIKQMAKELGV